MTNKEKDLLVSILNHLIEQLGYDVSVDGFGYNYKTDEDIVSANEDSLEDNLNWLWKDIKACKILKHVR